MIQYIKLMCTILFNTRLWHKTAVTTHRIVTAMMGGLNITQQLVDTDFAAGFFIYLFDDNGAIQAVATVF